MSKGGGGTPASPDPYATAAAQTKSNVTTAQTLAELNRVNQVTPFGSLKYSQEAAGFDQAGYDKALADYNKNKYTTTGGGLVWGPNSTTTMTPGKQTLNPNAVAPDRNKFVTPGNSWTATQSLSPELQGVADNVTSSLSQPFSLGGLPAMPTVDNAERQRVADQMMARLEPKFAQDDEALRTRLANQGLKVGSEAYGREMETQAQGRNDARIQADIAAGGEMAQMFGLGSQARDQGLREMMLQRQTPLNEAMALLQGSQINSPIPQTSMNPTDIQGNIYANYQGQQDAYNQRVASRNANTSALAGLGGTAMMALALSDRRMKEDINRVGYTDGGLPVYIFKYKGDETWHMGVMAQEAQEQYPDAVVESNGLLYVNYGRIQ